MASNQIVETVHSASNTPTMDHDTKEKGGIAVSAASASDSEEHASGIATDERPNGPTGNDIPLTWKLTSILLVSMIGFGSHWSSGITGAMKSTIKKQMKIDNKQYALLSASQDFMVTALMLVSGVVTDRIGGAGMIIKTLALLHVLIDFRRNLLWEHHLYHWVYSHCRSRANEELSVYDRGHNRPSVWRHRDTSCTVRRKSDLEDRPL